MCTTATEAHLHHAQVGELFVQLHVRVHFGRLPRLRSAQDKTSDGSASTRASLSTTSPPKTVWFGIFQSSEYLRLGVSSLFVARYCPAQERSEFLEAALPVQVQYARLRTSAPHDACNAHLLHAWCIVWYNKEQPHGCLRRQWTRHAFSPNPLRPHP